MVTGGLVGQGQRGHYDRFRGRLLWPIRDTSGDVIGFGARRIFDDDRIDAKYLNTPETPIYKKSHVLYGIDLARREIARASQAVVVEGYTDVMACHLAGVSTAVATCGTAFGDDHARVIRRLLHDHDEFRGEVIFTFDGDAAGPEGGAARVRGRPELRRPDLRRRRAVRPRPVRPAAQGGRRGGPRAGRPPGAALPLRARQRGRPLRPRPGRRPGRRDARGGPAGEPRSATGPRSTPFARELAGMLGIDVDQARAEVRRAASRGPAAAQPPGRAPRPSQPGAEPAPAPAAARPARPPLRAGARDAQAGRPAPRRPSAGWPATSTPTTSPTRPTARVWAAIDGRRRPGRAPATRPGRRGCGTARPTRRSSSALSALAVEPLLSAKEPTTRTSPRTSSGSRSSPRMRRIADLKSQAAAHQPGRARHRVQPDVRRAGRARAAPPQPARAGASAASA